MRWLLRRFLSDAEIRQIEADQAELHETWTRLHGLAVAGRRIRRERALLVPRLIAERVVTTISSVVAALPSAGKDARHAARGLVRTPGTAVTIVLNLGVALGATTAMLAIVRGVLLDPLPYAAVGVAGLDLHRQSAEQVPAIAGRLSGARSRSSSLQRGGGRSTDHGDHYRRRES